MDKWITSFHDGDMRAADGDGTGTPNVPLRCACWQIVDLTKLWRFGERVGTNVPIPQGPIIPYRRWRTTTRFSLPFLIRGTVLFDPDNYGGNYEGTAESNPWVGLEYNMEWLMTNVIADTGTREGTRLTELDTPSGDTRVGDIHYLDIIEGAVLVGHMKATLEIEVVQGRLT